MKNNSNGNRQRSGFFSESIIFSWISRLAAKITSVFKSSFIYYLFFGRHILSDSVLAENKYQSRSVKRKLTIPVKRFFMRQTEKSVIVNFIAKLFGALPDLSVKYIGSFWFAFGLFNAVMNTIKRYTMMQSDMMELYMSVTIILLSCIMVLSSKKVGTAISESKILSYFLFELLGLSRERTKVSARSVGRSDVFFLAGLAAGVIGYLTDPITVIIGLHIIPIAYEILVFPESSIVLMILLLPFLPQSKMIALCSFALLCWLIKLMRGKRVFALGLLDASVLFFGGTVLIGGIVSSSDASGFIPALGGAIPIFSFFLVVNLIRTSDFIERISKAAVISFSLISLITIFRAFLPVQMLTDILGSTNYNAINGFLSALPATRSFVPAAVMLMPFLITTLKAAKSRDAAIGYSFMLICSLICIALSLDLFAVITVIFGITVYNAVAGKKGLAKAIIAIPVTILLFLGSELAIKFFGSGSGYTITDIGDVGISRLLEDNFITGIGYGFEPFRRILPIYSSAEHSAAYSSMSLYSAITVGIGIAGLAVFIVLMLVLIRHYVIFENDASFTDEKTRLAASSGFVGIVSVLLLGFNTNIWYDSSMQLLFFLTVGTIAASIRASYREKIEKKPDGCYIELDLTKARQKNKNYL